MANNAQIAREVIESTFRVVNDPEYKSIAADGLCVPNHDYIKQQSKQHMSEDGNARVHPKIYKND